ncbi:MAG: T9SS type A sorting domain-containing protein [Lentimicrobium sp.]|nr:T9SS type A sorting domain-containing protein [Lentimicrobium sp.]
MKKIFTLIISLLLIVSHIFPQDWRSISNEPFRSPVIVLENTSVGTTVITINIAGYETLPVETPSGKQEKLMLAGGVNETETGYPDMQHLAVSLQIPERGKPEITILSADYTEYRDIKIAPSKGDPQYADLPAWSTYSYNEAVYNQDQFFPEMLVKADQPYIWCDVRGMALQIYPFSYNALNGTLRVYHNLSIEVSILNQPGENELTRYSASYGKLSSIQSAAAGHFENYTTSNRYTPVEEPGNMLILCPAQFMEEIRPFAEWKAQTGIPCEVIDVASFGNAEEIRQFVSEYYYTNGLTYLLLAGDAAQIPTLQAETGSSDNMYGYIAGNDHYPEVLVGRFPAETNEQLNTMVQRSIAYEKYGNGGAAYAGFAGIASELGPGDDGEKDYEHIRNISNLLLEDTYNNVTELYDGNQNGLDAQGNPTQAKVEQAINQGQGAIMYIGHGSINSWSTSGFSSDNVNNLENAEVHPFIWAAGCNSGDFVSTTCLAETWLRATSNGQPTGAVAAMMSTCRQSWYPPMEAQDEMALILAGRKTSVTTRTFGGISLSACMKMNDKYGLGGYRVTDTWNIFGDPSVVVRTTSPREILAHHAPVTGSDAREFVVKLPVSDALACITHNGKLLGAARAQDGVAHIELPGAGFEESVTLTVTAYNCKPYIAEIEVTDKPAIAIEPLPGNNNRKVSVYTSLQWLTSGGTDPAFYEVFIAEGENAQWSAPAQVVFGKELTFSSPLNYNTTYTWKVISHNNNGSVESGIFYFMTCNPPDEDFENQGFPRSNWLNNSSSAWLVDSETSFEGSYSLRSGSIENNESSRLAYECYTQTCDYLGFRKKVSSQNGSDKLQLIIDGTVAGEWSGENEWTEERFPIEPGTHLIEWIYSKDEAGAAGFDAAWLDNIYLPENESPVAIMDDFTTCPTGEIALNAQANGYSHVEWTSTGNGIFSNQSELESFYYPSREELESGSVMLMLNVYSNTLCEPLHHNVNIFIASSPELPQVNDTVLYAGEALYIELPDNGSLAFKLLPTGVSGNHFVINADDLQTGPNQLTLVSENEIGCSDEVTFTITKPAGSRPGQDAQLLLFPNPANESISFSMDETGIDHLSVQIYNIAGQLVLQQETSADFVNKLDINSLNTGIYSIRVEYANTVKSGRFIKTN